MSRLVGDEWLSEDTADTLSTIDGFNISVPDLDVTILSPVLSPGVLDNESFKDTNLVVTNSQDGVVKGGSEMNKSRQFILKRTGELLSLRSQLNEYELAESLPDLFWDKESKLEQYYDRVGKVLDVEPRIDKLNKRIDYANELVAVAREMSSEKRGHRLEWIIIILIAMEIAFELDDRGFPGWLPDKRRAGQAEGDD